MSQVKHENDRDILGLKKPRWDASVGIVGYEAVEYLPLTLKNIRTGIKDENIVATCPQQVYIGTDTRNVHHHGWNVFTETINPRDSERFLQAT